MHFLSRGLKRVRRGPEAAAGRGALCSAGLRGGHSAARGRRPPAGAIGRKGSPQRQRRDAPVQEGGAPVSHPELLLQRTAGGHARDASESCRAGNQVAYFDQNHPWRQEGADRNVNQTITIIIILLEVYVWWQGWCTSIHPTTDW